jgi:hypothetical protein
MEWRKLLPAFVVSLTVAVASWFGAPYVKSKMEGTHLNGVRGIISFWKGVATRPVPTWSAVVAVLFAVLVFVIVMRRKKEISKADLRIVVLPTPEPRWGIGAIKDVPYLSIHFHARLAHREKYSLEIVKAHLEGTTCVSPFMPVVVAGPYDRSTMIHFGVHPIFVQDGESITRRVFLIDQFGNKHVTEKVTFKPSNAPASRFGAAPIKCFFCGGTIAMEELHEASAVPAHKRCVR